MSFDAYCEWRNTRDLRVKCQAGFIAKRLEQRRPRQADASCLGLLCRVSIIWSVCARKVSEVRLPCECFYTGLSPSFSSCAQYLGTEIEIETTLRDGKVKEQDYAAFNWVV
jgi:hypothetical protein